MNETLIDLDRTDWEEAKGYPTGTQWKVLREEESKRTFLLQLPPNFEMEAHSSCNIAQHLVIDGEYECDGTSVKKGMYRYIPQRQTYRKLSSKNGAVILVVCETD